MGLREEAKQSLAAGDMAQAERCFEFLLSDDPNDMEAIRFVAGRHLARGNTAKALSLLQPAENIDAGDAEIQHLLGVVHLEMGDLHAGIRHLRHAKVLAPGLFVAQLRLGLALENLGERKEALVAYFGAVNTAQAHGRWLSDQSTAPALRDHVKHAIRFIDIERPRFFEQLLEPLRARHEPSELRRVERCLAGYLGHETLAIPDSRQKPLFLYFPDIPSQPYYPNSRFPWMEQLEGAFDVIRGELNRALEKSGELEPFLDIKTAEQAAGLLHTSGPREAAWDAYFFYRHGDRYDEHCAWCPRTAELLDTLPLARIRDHSPETLFSVLRPGTHILPHRGVTNTRLVTHLPLIVPPDCALRVGGELHEWREGHCVTFDDTFEHEAWNRSDQTRVVLILDCWNPDLTEVEREAVTVLVESIGDFNRACEIATPDT